MRAPRGAGANWPPQVMGIDDALAAWVDAHRAPMAPERTRAAALLQAQGAEAVGPVLAASRAGRVDATACFSLLCTIEPSGLGQTLASAEGDDAEGAGALRALAWRKPVPAELIDLLPRAWRAPGREKRLAGLWATVEIAPRLRLDLGSDAEGRLRAESLALLDTLQGDDAVLANLAVQAIGLLKPPAGDSVPVLVRALEAALEERDRHGTPRDVHPLVATLGAYGREAAAAIPQLVLALKQRRAVTAALALAQIGAAAVAILPELKAVRDEHEGRSKSETKAFRASLGKAMRQLEAAGKAPRAKKGAAIEGDPYLLDLLRRMSSPSLLAVGSSASSPSFQAHREAEKLSDPALLPRLMAILAQPVPDRMFEDGLFVLGYLTRRPAMQPGSGPCWPSRGTTSRPGGGSPSSTGSRARVPRRSRPRSSRSCSSIVGAGGSISTRPSTLSRSAPTRTACASSSPWPSTSRMTSITPTSRCWPFAASPTRRPAPVSSRSSPIPVSAGARSRTARSGPGRSRRWAPSATPSPSPSSRRSSKATAAASTPIWCRPSPVSIGTKPGPTSSWPSVRARPSCAGWRRRTVASSVPS